MIFLGADPAFYKTSRHSRVFATPSRYDWRCLHIPWENRERAGGSAAPGQKRAGQLRFSRFPGSGRGSGRALPSRPGRGEAGSSLWPQTSSPRRGRSRLFSGRELCGYRSAKASQNKDKSGARALPLLDTGQGRGSELCRTRRCLRATSEHLLGQSCSVFSWTPFSFRCPRIYLQEPRAGGDAEMLIAIMSMWSY